MPVYEYRCNACKKEFERLVFGNQVMKCPDCGSADVTKKMSVFGMSGVENPGTGSGSSACGSCSGKSCSTC